MKCAGCNGPIATGASRLVVHDATGGPVGVFHSGQGQRCYLDALDRHMALDRGAPRQIDARAGGGQNSGPRAGAIETATGGPNPGLVP